MSTGQGYPNLAEGGGAPPPAYNEAASAPSAPAYNPNAVQPQQPAQQVVYQQPQQQPNIKYVDQNGNPVAPPTQPQVIQQPASNIRYVDQFGNPVAPPTQQTVQTQVVQQPNIRYVDQFGNPVAPPTQQTVQPIIINNNTNQSATVVAQPYRRERVDDPSCLYVLACFGFFFWPIGAIGMCAYNCGSGLPPKQNQAFKILVLLTIFGIIFNIMWYVMSTD